MKTTNGVVIVEKKKYPYTLTQKKNGVVHVECVAAAIAQDFPAEDIAALLIDLPNLIEAEQSHQERQSGVIRFRTTPEDKRLIEAKAKASGKTVSKFVRDLALGA